MAAKATLQSDRRTSSLPLNADIYRGDDHVSFGRPDRQGAFGKISGDERLVADTLCSTRVSYFTVLLWPRPYYCRAF